MKEISAMPLKLHLRIFSICLFMFSSCQESEVVEPLATNEDDLPEAEVGYPGVDEELWQYFERFEEEALKRGNNINLREVDVTGFVEEIAAQNVAGRCNFNQFQPNRVTIDEEFWLRASDRFREFVVFHELGHCVLFRAHREDANSRNFCLSIMRSGTGSCIDNYNAISRDPYLDELFDEAFEGDIFATHFTSAEFDR